MYTMLQLGPLEKNQQFACKDSGVTAATQLGQDLALPGDMPLALAHMPFNHFQFGFGVHDVASPKRATIHHFPSCNRARRNYARSGHSVVERYLRPLSQISTATVLPAISPASK
jgi:hypothetical protein